MVVLKEKVNLNRVKCFFNLWFTKIMTNNKLHEFIKSKIIVYLINFSYILNILANHRFHK